MSGMGVRMPGISVRIVSESVADINRNRCPDDPGIRTLVTYFQRVSTQLAGSPHEMADVSRLAESTFLTCFVAFERFVNDLFLAYLNRDFSVYQQYVLNRAHKAVQKNSGLWAANRTRWLWIDHVQLAEVEKAVVPGGRNVAFGTADDIKRKARLWLIPAHRSRILSLPSQATRLIDTAKGIRNFIAHQSAAAKKVMNDRLETVDRGGRNRHLGRGANQIHQVGSYLKAVFGDKRRVVLYADRLKDIAQRM